MNQATDRPVTLGFPFKLEYVKMVVIIGETTKVPGEKTHGALYIMVALLISVISIDTGLPGLSVKTSLSCTLTVAHITAEHTFMSPCCYG